MRNAKKTLSLVMVAIFTTFIVLSGIPAGAVTTAQAKAQVSKATAAVVKVEKFVKVANFNPTSATTLNTAATKEVAKVKSLGKTYAKTYTALNARTTAVAKKIATRKAAIARAAAELAKLYADADKAVAEAEKLTDADNGVDLVGDEAALAAAQGAVTAALEYIVKLDKNTSNYKGLMARVDAANNVIVKAMDDKAAAEAAAQAEKDAQAAAEKAAAEAKAAADAAETAVVAVEKAPLTTADEVKAIEALQTTATTAIAAVKDTEAAAAFTARMKVVAEKVTAANAKIAADAAAAEEAKKPATVTAVTAVDKTITVNFSKKPLTTPAATDFVVTKAIGTAAATTVTGVTVTVVNDTQVTLAVPTVDATDAEQSVVYSVAYSAGTAVAAPAFTVAKAIGLTVDSVTATNLKELTVKFNKEVDEDTVVVGNFTIGGNAAADVALADDNKTVTVVVANADVAATQPANYDIVVQNVKDTKGVAMAKYTTTTRIFDNTIPVAQSVKLTGPNTFDITFSEPIKTAGTVSVNSGVYGVNPIVLDDSNVVSVTLSASALVDGSYTLDLSGFKDYAGFSMDATKLTLAYTKNVTLPTATISSAKQTEVVVKFDRAVTLVNDASTNNMRNYFYHTFSGWTPDAVVASADKTTYTLTFTTTPIPEGNANVVVKYVTATAGTDIVDAWGNKLAANITLPVSVTADKVAPTITKTTVVNEQTIDFYFSEDITQAVAETETNFTVKDSTGATVSTAFTNTYTEDATTSTYKVRMVFATKLAGGNYTVDVKNMTDESIAHNTMTAITLPFTVTDLTAIAGAADVTATYVDVATTGDIIYVTFPEKMATTGQYSVLNANNYLLGTDALPEGTTLAMFGSTGKVVKIVLGDAAVAAAGKKLTIGRVADLAGNATTVLSFVANNDTAMAAETAPVVTAVKQTDTNKITIIVDKPLSVVLPSGFLIGAAGRQLAQIDSWKVNDDNETEIYATLNAADATSAADTSAIIAAFNTAANILVSETGVKMVAADYAATIADYRAPKLIADDATTTTVNEAVVDVAGAANNGIFDIKFTEALDTTAGMAALMAQDLVIVKVNADGTETALIAGVGYTTAIDSNNNLRVTLATAPVAGDANAVTYKVKTKDAINYIKDNSAQHNKAVLFTTPISVKVVSE